MHTQLLASEAEIIDTVLAELDVIFDGAASTNYLGSIASKNGVNDPTHKVPGSRGFVYQRKTRKTLNEPLDGRVYFAGKCMTCINKWVYRG